MINGWIILDKPVGIGSTPCVSAVKRALRDAGEPKHRVGHGGTLDPLASGILPIAIGEATKLAGRMLDSDKTYEFTIKFGIETATLDLEGEIVREARLPECARVWDAIRAFHGEIDQIPPAYSALKVKGERAYDLARTGQVFDLPPRRVHIRDLISTDRIGNCRGEELVDEVHLRAHVSKGTYIRSLARDIAAHAGSVCHVTKLRRVRAGPFNTAQAISLDKLGELAKARSLDGAVLPLSAGLDDIPALPVTPEEAKLLRHGQTLTRTLANAGLYLATDDDRPVALVEAGPDGLRVVRGFNI